MNGKLKIGISGRLERNVFHSPDGCWYWVGSVHTNGYGWIKIDRKWRTTHRVSYETFKGPIPKGLCVLHSCDNRLCINPEHLWLGTVNDNNKDMYDKNRNYIPELGESNPNSKLKASDIPLIIADRANGLSWSKLASKFNVSDHAMRSIFKGRTWSHLTGIKKLQTLSK